MSTVLPQEYAGFWPRLAAFAIDIFLFALISNLLLVILHRLTGGAVSLWALEGLNTWLYLFVAACCWWRFQGTPGKLMMGCFVVDAQTRQAPGFKQALLRAVGYVLSFLPLLLGFFWMAWDKRKQGWHDKLAGTVVLLDRRHELYDESQKSLEQLIKELR